MRRGWLGAAGTALALGTAACGHSQAHSATPPAVTIPPSPVSIPAVSSPPVSTISASPSPSSTASSTSPSASPSSSPSPSATAGGRCRESQLSLSFGQGQGGVGHLGLVLVLHNTSAVSCDLYGYVGLRLDNANRAFLPTTVVRGGGYLYRDPGPHTITLAPGGTASAGLEWDHIPSAGDPNPCPTSTYLQVTPPNATHYLFAQEAIQACNHGQLLVTAMQSGAQGPS